MYKKVFWFAMLIGLLAFGIAWQWYWQRKPRSDKHITLQFTGNHLPGIGFERIPLDSTANGLFTSLTFGPDRRLYANAMDGKIHRFAVREDGSLQLTDVFRPFADSAKLLIGMDFAPTASPDSLVLWITYSDFAGVQDAPPWDGNLAKLVLSPTDNTVLDFQQVLDHLPRSVKDHLTNGIDFGPDGALYINQGSNTAMGKANGNAWGDQEETLLSGAVLRLDVAKLPAQLPLDAQTIDADGPYDPFAPDAPLTLYATGLRNAYDMVWHSNGLLYVPVNGSNAGGKSPSSDPQSPDYIAPFPTYTYSGPVIPSVNKIHPSQNDWLYQIKKGRYYGHPNPVRAEYVLNRGAADVQSWKYKNVRPPAHFDPAIYNFGKHVSPNGVIEYQHAGPLKGMLLVARFVNYSDVMALSVGEGIVGVLHAYDGATLGLANLDNPLDLCEDPSTGNLYVSEFGGTGRIAAFKVTQQSASQPVLASKLTEEELAINESNVTYCTSTGEIGLGKKIYENKCAVCHGKVGEGGLGPNMQDEQWIYGGDIKSVFKTVKYGTDNGMETWRTKLSPREIQLVSSYVISIHDELEGRQAQGAQ